MSDFAQFVQILVTEKYSEAEVIRLVTDNLKSIMRSHSMKHSLKRKTTQIMDKVEFHYTPKHASWLNAAEIEINVMDIECTGRRIGDMQTIEHEVGCMDKKRE